MIEAPKAGQGVTLDLGYRNCMMNCRWTGESWAYRITFPSGQSFGDSGFDDVDTAFREARELINKAKSQ